VSTPPSPERPPRPDEVLAFHNGDTLENIPVVREPRGRRLPWRAVAAGGAVAIVVGACTAVILGRPAGSGHAATAGAPPRATPRAAATLHVERAVPSPSPTPSSAACLPVAFKTAGGPAGCKPKAEVCAPGAPWYVTDIETVCGGPAPLQAVHVVSEPATGGDPGSSYCLAWTGSSDGTGRDATLLMNAPGYRCGAYLVGANGQAVQADGTAVFSDTPPDCADSYPGTRMTYPAVLDFTGTGDDQPPQYVCVLADVGA